MKEKDYPTKRYLIECKGDNIQAAGDMKRDIQEAVKGIAEYLWSHNCWLTVTELEHTNINANLKPNRRLNKNGTTNKLVRR